MAVPAGYRKATPEEEERYRLGSAPAGLRKATPAEKAQYEYDQSAWYEKAGEGVDQSFTELGHGLNDLVGGNFVSDQDRAALEAQQGIEGGWKTAGQVGGELAQVLIPGGLAGKAASKGLMMAMKADKLSKAARYGSALAGDVLATGAVEELHGRDGATAAGVTAGVGAALPVVGKFAAPVRKGAQELMDAGVRLTPGQARGGLVGLAEESMTYIPGVAGGVRKMREKALKDWNQYIRTGDALPDGWAGPQQYQQVMKEAFDEAYGDLYKGDIPLASDLGARWGNIIKDARKLMDPKEFNKFGRQIANFTDPLRKGTTSGKTIQQTDRNLTKLSRQANARGDKLLSDAYAQARDELRASLPKAKREQLTELNEAYTKFSVLRDATGKAAPSKRAPPGMITPSDLMASSIKGRKAAASVGAAPLQKEAEQAVEILGANMPLGSGVQGVAANLGVPATVGLGLMDVGTLGGAAAARGALVNPLMRGAIADPANSLLAKGAAALTRVGAGVGASRITEEEREAERQRQMARALRGY